MVEFEHEKYLRVNDINKQELSEELQSLIDEFEEEFGKYSPNSLKGKVDSVLALSKLIKRKIADELSADELAEELSTEELAIWVMEQALDGKLEVKVSWRSLKEKGFPISKPSPKAPKVIAGKYRVSRAFGSNNVLIQKKRDAAN